MRKVVYLLALVVIIALSIGTASCSGQEKTELRVLHAGSLIVPFKDIEVEFEELHPDIGA